MDILNIDDKRIADKKFFYLKYFVDTDGNLIYSKRKKSEKEYEEEFVDERDYQHHPDMAKTIIEENLELKSIFEKLKKEFPDLIAEPIQFIIFWGYVLVNKNSSFNWIEYDSVTIPEIVKSRIDEEKPKENGFSSYDLVNQYTDPEEYNELSRLHKRISEEKSKMEQNKNKIDLKKDDGQR